MHNQFKFVFASEESKSNSKGRRKEKKRKENKPRFVIRKDWLPFDSFLTFLSVQFFFLFTIFLFHMCVIELFDVTIKKRQIIGYDRKSTCKSVLERGILIGVKRSAGLSPFDMVLWVL